MRLSIKITVIFCLGIFIYSSLYAQKGFPFDNEIREFKKQDNEKSPPQNAILFLGSSSIRKWTDLESRFSGTPIIRRGVGGCELWQVVDFYTPFVLFPYQPRKIFLYAGDNDIASGRSSEFVLQQFKKFMNMVDSGLPKAKVYFMSIKECPARAKYYPEVKKTNELIKNYVKTIHSARFINLVDVIKAKNAQTPDSSLFESDYIHLNKAGYDRWAKVLKPYVR